MATLHQLKRLQTSLGTDEEVDQLREEVRALRDFTDLLSDLFWEQDAQLRFIRFFGPPTKVFRYHEGDFIGKQLWDTPITGESATRFAELAVIMEKRLPFHNATYKLPSVGGVPQYYSVSGKPLFDAQGEFTGYRGIGRNVTELRRTELANKDSVKLLSQIVDGSPVATFVLDAACRITHWNRACAILTGMSAESMLGSKDVWRAFCDAPKPSMAELLIEGEMEEVAKRYTKFSYSALTAGAFEAEFFYPQMGDGGRWLHGTAAPLNDVDGNLVGAIQTLLDVTERRKSQVALELLARCDGLTGLANRRTFDEKLDMEMKRAHREGLNLSLLMIDIDHFKMFNDTYGHQAGDHCLREVANTLQRMVHRPCDTVARYGGEEFAIILSGTDEEGAIAVARRILDGIAAQKLEHKHGVGGIATFSIGVATKTTAATMSPDRLIAIADEALYHAKHSGRNRFVCNKIKLFLSEQ